MGPSVRDPGRTGPPRRRLGCLGCLGRLFVYLVGVLVLGSLLVLAIDAVFAPWSFRMGGRFHVIPVWHGWGKIRSASGRDYALYVWFGPRHYSRSRGVRVSGGPAVEGWGTLCTPRGETFDLRVDGTLERNIGASTDGKQVNLYLRRRPWYFTWVGTWDSRPSLDFRGIWHNPDLVLDDRGSLDRAFAPDGTLRAATAALRPEEQHGATVTLHEGAKSEFEAACSELRSH